MMNNSDRVERATELFQQGYNCSQAVFCAYSDIFGFDFETSLKISSGFGGGFGRMREVCGAFCAVTLLAGLKEENADPNDKAKIYENIRNLADEFRKKTGSLICKDLLNVNSAPESHIPEKRTEQYYSKRPCPFIVKNAAEIVETFIFR